MAKLEICKDDGCENLLVFVHGFTGNRKTFSNAENKYLYEYLSEDILNISDIAFFTYTTRAFDLLYLRKMLNLIPYVKMNTKKSNPFSRYSQVLETTCSLQYGRYKTINFICHSMGGLIVKKYLVDNYDVNNKFTGFYITIGTPHNGTSYALLAKLFNNRQAKQLTPLSGLLSEVGEKWRDCRPEKVKYYCGIDDEVVPDVSGCPVSEEGSRVTVSGSHCEMPKPSSAKELIVQSLNHEIGSFMGLGRNIRCGPSVDDILFLNYRKSCEEFYLIRSSDMVLARTLEAKNIWSHGKSGSGKTATIQRYAIQEESNYCFIDLSPTRRGAAVSEIISDIYHSIFNFLRNKSYFNIDSHIVSESIINNISNLITCINGIDRFYLVIDELPLSDSFDFDDFIENIFILTNLIGNSTINGTSLRIAISTLFSPELYKTGSVSGKFGSCFYCHEIPLWDDDELRVLVGRIDVSLNLNFSSDEVEQLIRVSSGTPRIAKNIMQHYYVNKETCSLVESIARICGEGVFG